MFFTDYSKPLRFSHPKKANEFAQQLLERGFDWDNQKGRFVTDDASWEYSEAQVGFEGQSIKIVISTKRKEDSSLLITTLLLPIKLSPDILLKKK